MRATIFGTVLFISTALLVYSYIPDTGTNSQDTPMTLQGEGKSISGDGSGALNSQMRDELKELTSVMLRLQRDSQERVKEERAERVRLSDVLAELGNRVRALEGAANKLGTESDEPQKDPDGSKAKTVSEGNLGHWMDAALNVRNVNRASTQVAIEQAEKNLEGLPGVFLDDMSCGEAFCRASFSGENGEPPALHDLFGVPPFANEGFTINEPDGRVTLYFTQPGVSLEDLRNEAQQTAMFDLSR